VEITPEIPHSQLRQSVEFQTVTTKGRDWKMMYNGSVVGMVWRPKLDIGTRLELAVHTLLPTRAAAHEQKPGGS
jgi:hypothetical protein